MYCFLHHFFIIKILRICGLRSHFQHTLKCLFLTCQSRIFFLFNICFLGNAMLPCNLICHDKNQTDSVFGQFHYFFICFLLDCHFYSPFFILFCFLRLFTCIRFKIVIDFNLSCLMLLSYHTPTHNSIKS